MSSDKTRHGHFLKQFQAFDALTERRYQERLAESEAAPHDTDLARRADVLARELAFGMERTAHYAATGEVLPHPTESRRSDERKHEAIYLCPVCRSTEQAAGRFLRAETVPGNAHFGRLIPCPRCCPQQFGAYTMAHGRPPGIAAMPPRTEKRGVA